MQTDFWKKVEELFQAALAQPPEKRAQFLEDACPEDPRIRSEVQSLLNLAPTVGLFLEESPISSISELPFALAPGQRLGNFEILEAVGRGGMGEVYRARDLRLKREVAIKVLTAGGTASERRRFLYEAQAASSLNHPNIVTVYDVGESDGVSYIAMEFVAGKTLNALIPPKGMPVPESLAIGVQIAGALAVAHGAGIVHRDLKPGNVMVTESGAVKILDFGLAKRSEITGGHSDDVTRTLEPKTEPGTILGTAAYMSPEQAEGKHVDARTDIFSFGALLYETLTGKRAFGRSSTASTLAAILKEEPQPVRELIPIVPLELDRIVQRCLCKDPALRFQTAAELKSALQNPGETVVALPAQKPSVGLSWRRYSKALAAAAIFILLLVSGASLWQWSHRRTLPPEPRQRQLTKNSSENPITSEFISPDGKYLAYTDPRGLHIRLVGTGEVKDIPHPFGRGSDADMAVGGWFPDSTRFVATTNRRGQPPAGWTVSILGGAAKKLYDGFGTGPVSPDGSTIACSPDAKPREIWLMNADGQQARRVFESDKNDRLFSVVWSPDGQRLAYIKTHAGYGPDCDTIATPSGCKNEVSIESWDRQTGRTATILSNLHLQDLANLPGWMYSLAWVPDGRIIYGSPKGAPEDRSWSNCNLWQVRVDPKTGVAKGEPELLMNSDGFAANVAGATADGKQLVYLRATNQQSVYVADFDGTKIRLNTPRRLTDQQASEFPSAWTADSKSVVFASNRTGQPEIFKQRLDSEAAEPVARGFHDVFYITPLTPDGSWLLNVTAPREGSTADREISRIPIAGGVPIPVMKDKMLSVQCANAPAQLCVLEQPTSDRKSDIYSAFDPMKGRGRELARLAIDPNGGEWALSPDGTMIANLFGSPDASIRLASLNGQPDRLIHVKQWGDLRNINWAADSKGFFFACETKQHQSAVLLHVDLEGNGRVLWEVKGVSVYLSGLPSPDGQHLALWCGVSDNNVWMLENF